MRNKIFIATSFDGYIADENGGIDWLTNILSPSGSDGGFSKFIESIDAILMGRNTFEKVLSFGIEWPYSKKVFVWTNTLKAVPAHLDEKVEIMRGDIHQILRSIHQRGFSNLYVDGGRTIQSFMQENLIHEITVTVAPIILGRGIPLFKSIPRIELRHLSTQTFDNGMVQLKYEIKQKK